MKKVILGLIVAGLTACASGTKETTTTTTTTTTTAATETTEKTVEDIKTEAETAVKEVKKEATTTAKSFSTDFGDFVGTEDSRVTCTKNSDVRVISVLKSDTGSCGVVYEKFGVKKTVATAENDKDFCSKKQEQIKSNLEGPGFSCQ